MKLKLFFAVLFGLVLTSQNIYAQEISQTVNLDEKTIVKGYTINFKDKLLSLAVKPSSFKETTSFIINANTFNVNEVEQKKVKSQLYTINFNHRTNKPLLLKISWQSFSNQPKNIYWRANQTMSWQLLPSKTNNKETSAEIIESGEIILLEQKPNSSADVSKYISAKSAVVMDAKTGEVLYSKNANQKRSVASLTKLMTAMIYLERPQSWLVNAFITKDDKDIPVTIGLKDGESVTIKNLWFAMLTKSANDAAKAIARLTNLDKTNFVKRMNSWAKELDLKNTTFSDPSGLDVKNISTALDMATLARAAFNYPEIVEATGTKEVKITTSNNRELLIKNSTSLFDSDLKIIAAKTGYTTEAGRCQIIKASGQKRSVVVVVLGSDIGKHTTDAYDLGNWFSNN